MCEPALPCRGEDGHYQKGSSAGAPSSQGLLKGHGKVTTAIN
jgi:hypothetical protein